jgi:hypothetical protein
MTPEEEKAGKMAFDASLGEINKFADDLITQEVPENYKKIFEGEFSVGKLGYITTNAIASTIPTIAAGLLSGGTGAVMVGAGMGFDESKSIMKDAGLTDEQAEWAAFGLAIPIGFLEKYGADDLVRLFSGSGIRKEVATELAKKVAGKTLTKEAIYLETKKTFGELIKAKTAKLLTSGGKESITEMTQGEIVEGVKQFVQEVTGVDKDENMSTQDYVMQQLSQRGEEGVGGFLGGTSMQGFGTAYSAIANKQEFSPSAYTKAMEYADPAKFQQFQNDLMLEVQNGVLTEEQANEAITNVQAIQETNALIPNSVQNLDLRTDAVNLIIEKNNIAKEIEGKDPDLTIAENTRLAEIKKSLNEIALGNKPVVEEQQAAPTQPSETAPVSEAQTEAAPQTLPEVTNEIAQLREQEQAENEAIDPNDEVAKKEIYDKYDEAITPLLEQEKELKAEEAPVAEQAKGEVEVSPLESAKESISKRVQGDKLLDAQDLADELNDNKAEIDNDGMVTIYHRTTPENKKEIESTGKMKGLEDGVFFSTKETGQNEGYGESIVKLKVPIESIQIDDTFGDEAHVRIPTKKAGQIIDVKEYLPTLQTETTTPTSEQAPQAFPAQEGAESVQDNFQANAELEQIYRDLNAAVTKNVDKDTIRMLKANPTEAMVDKALRELQKKGVIKIDCK